jgi:hypothetical protein
MLVQTEIARLPSGILRQLKSYSDDSWNVEPPRCKNRVVSPFRLLSPSDTTPSIIRFLLVKFCNRGPNQMASSCLTRTDFDYGVALDFSRTCAQNESFTHLLRLVF